MAQFFDIYNIVFLALAVAIFLRLRSVLGRRTGNERPPADYTARERTEAPRPNGPDNVIPMPRNGGGERIEAKPDESRLDKVAAPGSALNTALKAILSADRSFDPEHFLQGAKAAYEMIVTAFAQGDRRTLQGLLARDVFDSFAAAIEAREKRGETMQSSFVGIDKAEIVEAQLRGTVSQLTVRFTSQLVSVTRDRSGTVVDGDPNRVTEVVDVWTFARDVSSRDPNWKLVATETAD